MDRLESVLANSPKEEYSSLIAKKIYDLTELQGCGNFEELKKNYRILANPFEVQKRDNYNLWLIEGNNESKKFKWLGEYTIKLSILFMIVYPIIVSTYWLYFLLLLIPLVAKASSLFSSISKILFYPIIIGLLIYTLYSTIYVIFGMLTPLVLLRFLPELSMKLYKDTVLKAAHTNELSFKYLYYIRMVDLLDKNNPNSSIITCK